MDGLGDEDRIVGLFLLGEGHALQRAQQFAEVARLLGGAEKLAFDAGNHLRQLPGDIVSICQFCFTRTRNMDIDRFIVEEQVFPPLDNSLGGFPIPRFFGLQPHGGVA